VQSGGFCTHGSVLFPPWHRPFLALYEQILSGNAIAIANSYPASNRAVYQAAAQAFRMPYWDWSTQYTLPPVVNSPYILINTRTGSTVLVNPLFQFEFPTGTASLFPNDIVGAARPRVVVGADVSADLQGEDGPDARQQRQQPA
jgi:hypothetical protein